MGCIGLLDCVYTGPGEAAGGRGRDRNARMCLKARQLTPHRQGSEGLSFGVSLPKCCGDTFQLKREKARLQSSHTGYCFLCVNDFTGRQARGLPDGGTFSTGKYRFHFCRTPHLPHGWDAGVLFEETEGTLLCSDLFHQAGDVEPLTSADVVGRSREAMKEYQTGILAEYVPYTPLTAQNLKKLADLKPKTLAIMHGSSFTGDCVRALGDLNVMLREVFGRQT